MINIETCHIILNLFYDLNPESYNITIAFIFRRNLRQMYKHL